MKTFRHAKNENGTTAYAGDAVGVSKSNIALLSSLLLFLLIVMLFSSCGAASKIVYMQDIQDELPLATQELKSLVLQRGDKVYITVYSRDEELAKMFNLRSINSGSSGGSSTGRNLSYTIDNDGKIDMPVIGPMKAEGLTRMELANAVKYKLLAGNLLRDPVVTVEYTNMGFSVLGEVGSPGRKTIERDHLTLLEAIAEAGDLNINGKRENVLVLRTVDGVQTPYRVDLTNVQSIYSSPVYYVQQNDVIYVEPTQVRANQSKLNANNARTPGFWISMGSMAVSFIVLLLSL